MARYVGVECAVHIIIAKEKSRPAAVTNKMRDKYDQIHADNIACGVSFAFTARNVKIFFSLEAVHLKK
jgi:hypothetical protein